MNQDLYETNKKLLQDLMQQVDISDIDELGAVAGVAAVVEEGKGAAPLTELVAILVVAPATALVFEGTCPTPVGAGASAGDAAAAEAEATAEAACSVVDLLDGLLDASDMFVPHKSVMMSMCNCWGRARC